MLPTTTIQDDQAGLAAATSPLSHRLMFVTLALAAFGLYAPTVLLPLVREYGELLGEERRLAAAVGKLESEVARRDDLLDAFRYDSEINERLALLDLHYRRPDEEILPVLAAGANAPALGAADQAETPGGLMLSA